MARFSYVAVIRVRFLMFLTPESTPRLETTVSELSQSDASKIDPQRTPRPSKGKSRGKSKSTLACTYRLLVGDG